MYYLVVNIQNYTLEPPFDKDPPQGHLTQHEHLLVCIFLSKYPYEILPGLIQDFFN